MIEFDSNNIGDQHWYFHLVGGAHGLKVTILSVKETNNEGVSSFLSSETYEMSFIFA